MATAIKGSLMGMLLLGLGRLAALAVFAVALVACGGGGGDAAPPSTGNPGPGTPGPGTPGPGDMTTCSPGTQNGARPAPATSTTELLITSPSTNPAILNVGMFPNGELCLAAGGVTGTDASFSIASTSPGADAGKFTIRDTGTHTAVLAFRTLPSYHAPDDADSNGLYEVRVVVANNQGVGDAQRMQALTLSVRLAGPVPVISGGPFTIPENSTLGVTVGTLTATNTGSAATTWSIISGNTDGFFRINTGTGVITVAQALVDAAAGTTADHIGPHNLRVQLQVGTAPASRVMADVRVTIEDVDLRIDGGPFAVAATALAGATVGTLRLQPAAQTSTQMWSITDGNIGSVFAISDAGVITTSPAFVTVAAAGSLLPDYNLMISASIAATPSTVQTQARSRAVRIEVRTAPPDTVVMTGCSPGTPNGLPRQPTSTDPLFFISPSTNPVILDTEMFPSRNLCLEAGGDTRDDTVFDVSLTRVQDPMPRADQDRFEVTDTGTHTGVLFFKDLPSYHTPADANGDGIYEVLVVAFNTRTNTDQTLVAGLNVNVQLVGPAPVISGGPFQVRDSAALGAEVGTLTPTIMGDGSDDIEWSIIDGNDDRYFSIDSDTGVIMVAQALVAAGASSSNAHVGDHELKVQLQVGTVASSTVTAEVTVTIEDSELRIDGGPFRIVASAPAGTMVGTLSLLPEAPTGTQSWDISSGNAGGLFAVNDMGVITTTAAFVTAASATDGHESFYDVTFTASITPAPPVPPKTLEVRIIPYMGLAKGDESPVYTFPTPLTQGNSYTFSSEVACPLHAPTDTSSCCLLRMVAPAAPVAGLGDSLPLQVATKVASAMPEVGNNGASLLWTFDQVDATATNLMLQIFVPEEGVPSSGVVCEASRPAMVEESTTTAANVPASPPMGQVFEGTNRINYEASNTGSLIGFVGSRIGDRFLLRAAAEPSSAGNTVVRGASRTTAVVETMIHKAGDLQLGGVATDFAPLVASVGAATVADIPPQAIDMHGNTLLVREYMAKVLDRQSFDDEGASMYGVVDFVLRDADGEEIRNAIYVDGYVLITPPTDICFTSGRCTPSLAVALDVVGHEWAHGILNSVGSTMMDRLPNFGEGGALSEAFPDWFGTTVEAYYRGGTMREPNWIFGETASHGLVGGGLRNLMDPSAINDEATCYRDIDEGWDPRGDMNPEMCTVDGNCIYNNAGVPNRMFYLLVTGNNGTELALDLQEAMELALEAAENYWASMTEMPDAMDGMISAAMEIYATTDQAVKKEQVTDALQAAWRAVGVTSGGPVACSGG